MQKQGQSKKYQTDQKKIRRILLPFILGLLTSVVVYYGYKYGMNTSVPASPVSESRFRDAPSFELSDYRGKKYRLKDFQGSLILIHFWASWCPPCIEEISQWAEIATPLKDRPLKLIAISLDQNWQDAEKIFPSQKLPSNVISLLDQTGKVPDSYGTFQYPETYLLSPDLKILTKWVGPQKWNGPEIQNLLREATQWMKPKNPSKK